MSVTSWFASFNWRVVFTSSTRGYAFQFSTTTGTVPATLAKSLELMANSDEFISVIIDLFFRLMYCVGPKLDPETPEGAARSHAWHVYLEIPYALRSCYIQQSLGYYAQAALIPRLLVEGLVNIEYVKKHPASVSAVWAGKPKRIQMKTIFNDVAPADLYDVIYGRLLSSFSHGRIGSSMFRVNRRSRTDADILLGVEFNMKAATFVIHNLLIFTWAYLHRFPAHFPEGWQAADADTRKAYDECMDGLKIFRQNLLVGNPKTSFLFSSMGDLIPV